MPKERILVVEDEAAVARLTERCLQSLGYEVAGPVASAEEAIAETRRSKPDLVLMDILLDGRPEGIEAAAKIRSDYDVPVIFLTGKDDEQTLAQAASAEPMAYLLKPFTPAAIRAAIEVALRQDRAQRDRQEAARKELRDQCRASLAETISAVLSGQAAGRPGMAGGPKIQAGSTARREARIKSDSLRGFELQSYSPDGATRWSAGDIEALQSAGDGSIRLQGSLQKLLNRIMEE